MKVYKLNVLVIWVVVMKPFVPVVLTIGLLLPVLEVEERPLVNATVWIGLLQFKNQVSDELVVVADCIEAVVMPVVVKILSSDPEAAEVVKYPATSVVTV